MPCYLSCRLNSRKDGATKENREPINDFHQTLLQAKEKDIPPQDARKPHATRQHSEDRPRPQVSGAFAHLKNQRIVTIADSPAVNIPDSMELDVAQEPLPALKVDPVPPVASFISHEETRLEVNDPPKELSMIVEDDELVERSRASLGLPPHSPQDPVDTHIEPTKSNETIFHDAHDVDMEEDVMADSEEVRDGEEPPAHDDVTSMSATTFHTIPLSPRESDTEPTSARTAEFHTAPLPKISLPPIPVEEDAYSHTAPLPTVPSAHHEEYTAPLRDEPSAPVPGLSRKPSISQFAGLPAPSPLRKSLRTPGEPLAGVVVGASAPAHAVKRSSTSWLSKARETKALEITAKRTSTLGVAAATQGANKRKSGEMLEAAKDHPKASLKAQEEGEEERSAKVPKLSGTQPPFSSDKGSRQVASQDSVCPFSHCMSVSTPEFSSIVSRCSTIFQLTPGFRHCGCHTAHDRTGGR